MRTRGDEILAESFRIIDAEAGDHGFGPLEWPIVRRMIHASGDLDLRHLVQFSAHAAAAGVHALQQGVPIVTDVRMVAAGIQAPVCAALGVGLHCYLDVPNDVPNSLVNGMTRCAAAMQHAIATLPEAVYVVGNAPTALCTLCAAIRKGVARPSLVVAMPVGFVGVMESKDEAMSLAVPIITVRGRRGGSAVAAATVNALLLLAQAEGSA
jgi:precorrin-8X/cobalt-precorrin-8 methylmutase